MNDNMPARMKAALERQQAVNHHHGDCECGNEDPSFASLLETMRGADMSAEEAAASKSKELGDKRNIRKSLVRRIVGRVEEDFPGRRFSDLTILELGAGDGFFALIYAEVFPHLPPLNLMQLQHVTELSQADNVLSKCAFDVVLSVDFLSCLAFGRGLDPDDEEDVDEMRHLDQALSRMLSSSGGKLYDFMACAP